jgi:DNA-3-methyladenine glycosylase II
MLLTDKNTWKTGIVHLKKNDRVLSKIIDSNKDKFDMEWHSDYYASIVQAIIYQQVSGAAGAAIFKRLKSLYNGKVPTPKQFLNTPEVRIRNAGISPQKYSYLKDLCTRIIDGRLELDKFESLPDNAAIEELDAVKGIGRWTAEMFLIFSLHRCDIVPFDDLGLRKAVLKAYCLRKLPNKEKFKKIADPWHPYGTIASLYLWRSMDSVPAKKVKKQ